MREQRLVVFADYVCPFCYLAEAELQRVRRGGRVEVDGAAFELRPAGTPLPDMAAVTRLASWRQTVAPLAAELGVALTQPSLATRTRKAHEAAAYARGAGCFEAMHGAIFAAYWQHGRDIGRIDVLVEIGREVGLDAGGLKVALDIDQCTERVEQDEAWAARLRLEAVPAYVWTAGTTVAAEIRTGLLRYEELGAWVEHDHDL